MKNTSITAFKRKSVGFYNWLNMFAFIIMVAVNVLANTLPLGGNTSGQVSDRYSSLFTPAGVTFSIWGVIYILLGGAMIRQIISRNEKNSDWTLGTRPLFAISCMLNAGWIFCWHFGKITAATFIILVLFLNLAILTVLSDGDRLMSIAFGTYTAWIAVAGIASLFVQASYMGADMVSASGSVFATVALFTAGMLLSAATILTGNWTFTTVGIWAFAGIINRIMGQYRNSYYFVAVAALIMIAVMLTGTVYMFIKQYNRKKALSGRFSPSLNFGG